MVVRRDSTVVIRIFTLRVDMPNPFPPEVLRATAEFVIVLDQHYFVASTLLIVFLAVAVVMSQSKRRQRKYERLHHNRARPAPGSVIAHHSVIFSG
jgi:hypothetical protein